MLKTITGSKKRLFWTLQIVGWLGYALLNFIVGIEVLNRPDDYYVSSLIYAAAGMAITLCLRWIFKKVWDMRPWQVLLVSGISCLVACIIFTGFRNLIFIQYYGTFHWQELSPLDYFNLWDLFVSLYTIGAWSGLYFGIKYYRTIQKQNERLLKATGAAHEAQLKMLRYQLNPHFLFNTLNSISTLVLEGENYNANGMVTKLGGFLRHSLDSDPMQKVSLKSEIDALNLYLAIEKIRFDERLQVEYNIEPAAYRAMVPSLLLQPLIENSIKYAIAVSEDGGTLSVAGFIEDGKLNLRIEDTGPGIPGLSPPNADSRNGVGLTNTRDRLSVLYGGAHHLRLENIEPKGLAVTICIPFERSNQENS